jgi:hypothetical protein
MTWDRLGAAQLSKRRDAAVRSQVLDAVAPFSPWWRARLAALGRAPGEVATAAGLRSLPAAGERDVCPDGDPAGAAALVLQAGEQGWALHAPGPRLRGGLVRRLVAPRAYRSVVEADTRPTTFVTAGLSLRFPVASTRGDLDLVARAGARLWQVLGLTRADVLVAGLAPEPSATLQALRLAALGSGAPAAFPGDDADELAEALRLLPASVLALPSGRAADLLDEVADIGAPLDSLRTVLLVGAPSDRERADVAEALEAAGVRHAVVLAVHAPDAHRVLWAQCRPSAGGDTGLHTSPDLELVQLVDPESGGEGDVGGPREVVLTQLGFRGTALLRWRTGDLADRVTDEPCPACGRTVPRVVGVRRRALVPVLDLPAGRYAVDLRAVAGALLGRPDLIDWRVEVRAGVPELLLVHLAPAAGRDAADVAVAVARDVRAGAGLLPSQVVVSPVDRLPSGPGPSRRVLDRG